MILAPFWVLAENESAVLHQFYIKRQKIPAIARKLGFTEGYIRKLKTMGERMLDELPQETVRGALPCWYIREYPEGGQKSNR